MEKEYEFIPMEINTLAHSNLDNVKDLGKKSYTMEMFMKCNGSRIYLMVKEYIDGKMVQFIKVSGRIIKEILKVK